MNWKKFPFPLIVTMIYVTLGAMTNAWDKAWVIYLSVPIYYSIVNALRSSNQNGRENKPDNQEPEDKTDDWSDF